MEENDEQSDQKGCTYIKVLCNSIRGMDQKFGISAGQKVRFE